MKESLANTARHGKGDGTSSASPHQKRAQHAKGLRKNKNETSVANLLLKWVVAALVVAVLLTNVFTLVLQVVHYNGTGMEPGLQGGQTLVLLKSHKAEEGDIIAFYYNNQVLVRRVICTGGKQLEIDPEGAVSINGQLLPEPYVTNPALGQCNITFPHHVQTGTVFVMGDNRVQAMDSRLKEIGQVPEDRIIGKVLLVF